MNGSSPTPPDRRLRVGLFVTCLVDLVRPRIGFAALKLLEAAGCDVVVPMAQTCCGQPNYNSGERAGAQRLALGVVNAFAQCEYVVAPSGSCAGMIRTHYPELFSDRPDELERVRQLAARTYELIDFLVSVAKLEQVPGTFDGTIAYHDSCAGLRELGVKRQPRELLARVPGLTLREMEQPEQCCGFGGTFAIKLGDISARIADQKCQCVVDSGADAVVLGDLGCMLNIEGRLRRRGDAVRVLHVAEVLAGVAGSEE